MNEDGIRRAAAVLRGARRVAVLTGAGISAESGVPTFRGPEGLWRKFRAEDLATPEAFARDPVLVWKWYDWRRGIIAKVAPNPGHVVLAHWEKRFPDFMLITQNVDGLHALAGSRRLLELHGNIWQTRCPDEGRIVENRDVPLSPIPPRCSSCGGVLRPHIVWFGEELDPDILRRGFWRAAPRPRSCWPSGRRPSSTRPHRSPSRRPNPERRSSRSIPTPRLSPPKRTSRSAGKRAISCSGWRPPWISPRFRP